MSRLPIIIRRAKLTDLDEIYQIEVECFREEAFPRSLIKRFIENSGSIVLVATLGERIIGFLIGSIEKRMGKNFGHICSLDVKPEYRRMGVGSHLLEEFEKLLKDMNIEECDLVVHVDNIAAKSLYSKFGYKFSSFLRNYYGFGRDGIRMVKKLEQT